MTNPYQHPEKAHFHMITFMWGNPEDPKSSFVTDYTQAQGSGEFVAVPELEVELPPNTIGFETQPAVIRMPISVEPAIGMTKGEPHPIVAVVIEQAAISPTSGLKRDIVFIGEVSDATKNARGQVGMAELECIDLKARMDVVMGIPETVQCANTFGDKVCGIDLEAVREKSDGLNDVRITDIDGKRVTISDLTNTGELRYYHRGYVEVDGLRIDVREYVTGSSMDLVAAPPASWLDAECVVTPGCSKIISRCRFWENETRFMGLGYGTPAAHPLIEAESA